MNRPRYPEDEARQAIERAIDQASRCEPFPDRIARLHNSWIEVKPPRKADQKMRPKPLWDRIDDLENRLEELERQSKKTG